MENEVRIVRTESKTFVIPKDELLLDKYPLENDIRLVTRKPNEKIFVVEKKYLTDFREDSGNNITHEKDIETKYTI